MDAREYAEALQMEGRVSNQHPLMRKLHAERRSQQRREEYRKTPAYEFEKILTKEYPIYYHHHTLKEGESLEAYFCLTEGDYSQLGEGYKDNSRKILCLAVHEDKRRQGIGSKVMKDICWASDKSGCSIELFCYPFRMNFGEGYMATIDYLQDYGIGFTENVSWNKDEQKNAAMALLPWYQSFGFENVQLPDKSKTRLEWADEAYLLRTSRSAPRGYRKLMSKHKK